MLTQANFYSLGLCMIKKRLYCKLMTLALRVVVHTSNAGETPALFERLYCIGTDNILSGQFTQFGKNWVRQTPALICRRTLSRAHAAATMKPLQDAAAEGGVPSHLISNDTPFFHEGRGHSGLPTPPANGLTPAVNPLESAGFDRRRSAAVATSK